MPLLSGKTIAELPANAGLSANSIIEIQDESGLSTKLTLADLAAWIKTEESIVPINMPWQGVKLERTSDLVQASPMYINWQQVSLGDSVYWNVGQPTRITIPAGIAKVQLRGAVYASSITQQSRVLFIYKNGSSVAATSIGNGTGFYNNMSIQVFTPIMEVEAGDYFEMYFNSTGTGDVTIAPNSGTTFFELSVVETE